jgi:hypothetical protein
VPNPPQSQYSITDAVTKLLASQRKFIFNPHPFAIATGGFGCGKSHAAVVKGLILSSEFSQNRGIIGRYHATDLEDSVIPLFFEICPPDWIRNYSKDRKVVTLRNGSEILFRHIHDEGKKKLGKASRRVGANLGWFFIDQLEECRQEHWNTLVSRLRLAHIPKKFGFGTANPAGHDWIYQTWFAQDYHSFRKGEFFQVCNSPHGLGLAIRSEENRRSNGGFVADEDFDNMIAQMPDEWRSRYLDCSFEDFAGKIYRDYHLSSVHNILPFEIPDEWPWGFSIDVGGSAPWAIGAWRVDPWHNNILVDEFYKPGVDAAEVAAWIRGHVKLRPTTLGVIDYENRLATLELQQLLRFSIRPAMKSVRPGIIQVGGQMRVNPLMPLPPWYEKTQPQFSRFRGMGSPQIFAVKSKCPKWSWEMDNYVWDDVENSKPKKENDHHADQTRYYVTALPKAHLYKTPVTSAERHLEKLKRTDPLSAKEAVSMERHRRERTRQQSPEGVLAELEDFDEREEMVVAQGNPNYDWNDEE